MNSVLFDDAFVESKNSASLRLEQPLCKSGLFLLPDRPWEAGGLTGGSNVSVIEYGGECKLWYGVPVGKLGSKKEKELKKKLAVPEFKNLDEKILDDFFSRTNRMLCYAVS